MMARDSKLRDILGSDPGFRVPDGYFDEVYAKVMRELPEQVAPEVRRAAPWVRMRPYVYLAAMFAGIWCMMQMFHTLSSESRVSLDNPPAAVAAAMTDMMEEPAQAMTLLAHSPTNDREVVASLKEQYSSDFGEFERDFGYDLQPGYESIEIPEHLLEGDNSITDGGAGAPQADSSTN